MTDRAFPASRTIIGLAMGATMLLGSSMGLTSAFAQKHRRGAAAATAGTDAAATDMAPKRHRRAGGEAEAPAITPAPQPVTLPYDPPAKANVVFVLADDMGYGDLRVTGSDLVPTPQLDKLANDNLLMTQFYDPTPICSASRSGFFTGQFPARNHFVRHLGNHNVNTAVGQDDVLDINAPNLARTLHDAGYATAHFGKWHLGGGDCVPESLKVPAATDYGFDVATTAVGGGGMAETASKKCPAGQVMRGKGQIDLQGYTYAQRSQEFVNLAMNFIHDRAQPQPFYVNVWFNAVHVDWRPDDTQRAHYKDVINVKAGSPLDNPAQHDFLTILADMDNQIGRLVDYLKASKYRNGDSLYDHTVILFTSDNGPTWRIEKVTTPDGMNIVPTPGSANYMAPGGGGTQQLTGRKASLYEGGVRQPLIVHLPKTTIANHRDDTTVGSGIDLLPTLVSYLGVQPKQPLNSDGVDLSQAWKGRPIANRGKDILWVYGYTGDASKSSHPAHEDECSPGFALRRGNYKILANPVNYRVASADQIQFAGKPEIYDLSKSVVEHGNQLQGGAYDRVAPELEKELKAQVFRNVSQRNYPAQTASGKICPTNGSTTHLKGDNEAE